MAQADQEIIQRVLAGEKKAYAELVDRHKDKAMTLAVRMLRNREEAEEAVQDAFVRAFNALGRFEWRSSFSTWFYRIVYNVCSTALGKKGEEIYVPLQGDDEESIRELPDTGATPDLQFETREFRDAVLRAIQNLPAAYSGIVNLFFLQDMSYEEIVEVTGMPLGTVKAKLFRARNLMRKSVAEYFEQSPAALPSRIAPAFK